MKFTIIIVLIMHFNAGREMRKFPLSTAIIFLFITIVTTLNAPLCFPAQETN